MSARTPEDDSAPPLSNDPPSLSNDAPAVSNEDGRASKRRFAQVLKLAFVLLGILLGGFAVAAWFGGEPEHLPFEYDGFD